MKRAQSPCLHDSGHDERPAKVRRQESLSTPSGSLKREQEEQIKVQHPPSPFSPNPDSENPVNLERQATTRPFLTNTATEHTDEIFDWIPAPSEIDFHNVLQNRSETRLFMDLHPLLIPSAENQFIQGKARLKDVIDGYNDLWVKMEPIYGPKPQPDHARDKKSLYTAREDIYFLYLTAEIKCGNQALDFADWQNMHSMCIALRAVVSLSWMAGCPKWVYRRILGFSVSHDLDGLRIYGYYPDIDGENTSYFWVDVEIESQLSRTGSQERPGIRRTASSQGRGLQPELRMMVQSLQQQLAEQREREDKREAEQKVREEKLLAEQREREERLLAEQREREERLLAEQREQKAREDRLLAQLEQLTRKLIEK
ncbi:uncharacterized protein TRUGW13939_11554 [Talaromyces rugulosus]|uniref:DUF7924 domain-containing protein n=1 Tax=Talaromyces rugulosus TaxID=121627 RepID=A0A7H8RD19_TALRU|nr:uncharacterized protein TRUGW13939_11554 [Talaromyces rugulosus]QKX64380.1 hypothetical protein TRUGW13939_11554 [Talaromyces rugulosus]